MIARLLVVALIAVVPIAAQAQGAEASASMSAAARDLYQEGVTAAGAGDLEHAIASFERSYALSPRDATLLNLAQVQEQAGHLVAALEAYRRFVARADPDMTARYGERARAAADALEPRIAHLTIVALGSEDGDVVHLDGAVVAAESLGVALPIDPGHHDVTVTRGEDECASTATTLGEGARGDVELRARCPVHEVVLDPAAVVDAPIEPPPPAHGDDTVLFVGLGVGAAVVVAGVIILAVVLAQPSAPMPFVGNVGPGTYSTP